MLASACEKKEGIRECQRGCNSVVLFMEFGARVSTTLND